MPAHLLPHMWARHEVRYLVVAGTTQLGYIGLVAIGYVALGWHYMVAIAVAQVVTIAAAFPAYRHLVFESQGRPSKDFTKFLSVWVTGATAGVAGTPFLVELFGMNPVAAQILVILVVSVGSYLGHRFFSFRSPQVSPMDETIGPLT